MTALPVHIRPAAAVIGALLLATLAGLPISANADSARSTTTASAPDAGWPRIAFPDGSGGIAVPPGYRINNAGRGSAELQGPNGESMSVGISMPIGPAQFAMPGVLAGPYLSPAQAYAWVSDTLSQRGGGARTRIIEVLPTAALTQNGQAAYLLAEHSAGSRRNLAFALVNSANLGNGYWQFYMSVVTAPAAAFPQAFPQMIAAWQSWSVSNAEMQRRTAQALGTMKETSAIMQATAEGRRTSAWQQQLTGLTLAGRWVIEDSRDGSRREVSSGQWNALDEAEPGRWRRLGAAEIGR